MNLLVFFFWTGELPHSHSFERKYAGHRVRTRVAELAAHDAGQTSDSPVPTIQTVLLHVLLERFILNQISTQHGVTSLECTYITYCFLNSGIDFKTVQTRSD